LNFSIELFTTTIHLIEFIVAEFNPVVNLTPAPIEPSWVIEGNPVAQVPRGSTRMTS
jgi:hypothetical protein